ncbi:MAG TPA: hypothetical protein VKT78_14255 [Fimbriimonadaceae bacterium]|nr:hypothetical protein [Fimbriimonadaceae bacterium]
MIAPALLAYALLYPRAAALAAWGADTLRLTQRSCYHAELALYLENGSGRPVDLGAEANLILAFAAAAEYEPKFLPDLRAAEGCLDRYWDASGATPGYADYPIREGEQTEKSYSNNSVLAVALAGAARVTKSDEDAQRCSKALRFALSGEDAKAGGIPDRVGGPKSANTTALTALAILRQSEISSPAHAEQLYVWIRTNLRDPATNLLRPRLVEAGVAPGYPLPSDTAQLIELACLLAGATGELKYAEQARRLEMLSIERWLPAGKIDAETLAGTQLAEAWIDRIRRCPGKGETYGAALQAYAALQALHDSGRDRAGHYGHRFAEPPAGAWSVADQSAAACAFFTTALALRNAKG